ncbi:glycosyltransferase family 2 protein [Cellulomonas sp. JH27-2]|nr:glycosyltransferase family 2 protein [Cellulomonas sp. JH27-2]
MAAPVSVDLVLPCLDEARALAWLLPRVPAGVRPVVVDNGSTDGSAQVAADLGALVVPEARKGFGAACHAGLQAATADVVAFMDADGSLDPIELERVLAPVRDGRSDLVLGRRRPVSSAAWPWHLRYANRVLTRRLERRTGVRLHDLGPMRAARRADLLGLDIVDRRSGYPLEMVVRAADRSWRIDEVDVTYAARTGRSKVTGTPLGLVRAVRDMSAVLAS